MKTSNKLLLTAVLVLLISLALYDTALRAEYRKGTFRNPFKDFVTLNYQDFNAVDLPAASQASVRIEAGPYRVRVYKPLNEFLQASQHGKQLTLALRFPKDDRSFLNASQPAIVISCPTLAALRTNARYLVEGQLKINHKVSGWNPQQVQVQGFQQDSLLVQADNGSQVELLRNTLTSLRVAAGQHDPAGAPMLRLQADNHIQHASLTMRAKSNLLLNAQIQDLRYQFSDSATATMPGRMLSRMNK